VPKAEPYRLRHMRYLIEKVSQDAISSSMLKISGNEVMEILGVPPGPVVGDVLNILLSGVINNPEENESNILRKQVEEMKSKKEEEIKEMAKRAKTEISQTETKRDEMTKKRYWVS